MKIKGLVKIKKEKIIRAMIESTLNLLLKRAKFDSKRSIRNTIELALNNSRGSFQRELFAGAQRMLENENSAYYTLAERVVSNVNHDIIKQFGINLGYNGCTCGAERIRQNEKKLKFHIPWSLYISCDNDCDIVSKVNEIVSHGMNLGIYVYFIFGNTSLDIKMREVYRHFCDCAFIAMCGAENIGESFAQDFNGINNVMISVASNDRRQLAAACDKMKNCGRLYCIHEFYNNDSAANLFTEDKLKFYDDAGAVFVTALPHKECSMTVLQNVKQQVADIRFGQKYPYFAIDFASDILAIDHVISDDTCWVLFDSDGSVYSSKGTYSGDEYSLSAHSLEEILSKVTPPALK